MALEIERKFMVNGDFKSHASGATRITQGYLSSVPERNVRVRIRGDRGYITVKGVGNESGTTRFEWEKEISVAEVEALMQICEPGVIDKTRYLVEQGAHSYEVDAVPGDTTGRVVAEVELGSEDERFAKPDWLGEEVTGDAKYYNAMLARCPYKNW